MKKLFTTTRTLNDHIKITTATTVLLLAYFSIIYVAGVHAFHSTSTTRSGFFLPSMHHSRHSFPFRHQKSTTTSVTRTALKHKIPWSSSSALQASPLTWLASTPLASIGVLAGIVVVHEMGHYLAAKSFGMTVEEFSIGFGPKLFGFNNTKTAEEFNLRALPLGGYVRFPDNYNSTDYEARKQQALATFQAEKEAEKLRRLEKDLDWGSRLLNIVTFGAVWQRRKQQQEPDQSSSAVAAASDADQPFWKRNAIKEEERAVLESVEMVYYDDPNLLQNRPWTERAVVLSAGVVRRPPHIILYL
jgi:Peptidase family M50